MDIIEVLKLIADVNRMRILNILYSRGKVCVCVLEEILELNQSNLSRHLNKLKKAGLIVGERRSQWIDYEISEEFLNKNSFVREILEERLEGEVFLTDLSKAGCTNC